MNRSSERCIISGNTIDSDLQTGPGRGQLSCTKHMLNVFPLKGIQTGLFSV
jgi:hypothetical protein